MVLRPPIHARLIHDTARLRRVGDRLVFGKSEHAVFTLMRETSESRFEIYRDYAGRYRWRLRGRERRIAADSPRSYASPESARRAARQAKSAAHRANIADPSHNRG